MKATASASATWSSGTRSRLPGIIFWARLNENNRAPTPIMDIINILAVALRAKNPADPVSQTTRARVAINVAVNARVRTQGLAMGFTGFKSTRTEVKTRSLNREGSD